MAPDQTIRAMGNNSAFTMDIFGFFQHPSRHNFTIPNSSMRFPFPRMETPDHFKIFRWDSLFQGWKLPTISNFPMRFPFLRMETPDHFEIFQWDYLFQRWKFLAISKFFDNIKLETSHWCYWIMAKEEAICMLEVLASLSSSFSIHNIWSNMRDTH